MSAGSKGELAANITGKYFINIFCFILSSVVRSTLQKQCRIFFASLRYYKGASVCAYSQIPKMKQMLKSWPKDSTPADTHNMKPSICLNRFKAPILKAVLIG